MAGDSDGTIRITVTRDRMAAVAVVAPPCGRGAAVTVEDVKAALARAGVCHGICATERMKVYLEQGLAEPVSFIVATATHSTMGSDAAVAFPWQPDDEPDGGALSLRALRCEGLPLVNKGDIIAVKTPPTQGAQAVNVMGETHPGEWGFDIAIKCGANVNVSADGLVFTTAIDGCPRLADGALCVDHIYTVSGDVDESTGNIRFNGALNIPGSVQDGRIVECAGSVFVGGGVGAARIESGGDVFVRETVGTGAHGVVSARGSVCAGGIRDSAVDAGRDVAVESGITDSAVRANGMVVCAGAQARISGGSVQARGGIIAPQLGKDKDTKTKLNVGLGFVFRGDKKPAASAQHFYGLAAVRATQFMHPGCMVHIGNRIKSIRDTLKKASFTVEPNAMVVLTYFDESVNAFRVQGISAGARPRTALIVEDARTLRVKLKKLLESAGVKVIGEAANGRTGVEMFTSMKPDIVTMDITMPDMDGLTALKAIRRIQPDARVIMVSAMGQKEMIIQSMNAGAFDFITKPLVPDQVHEIILRALAARPRA